MPAEPRAAETRPAVWRVCVQANAMLRGVLTTVMLPISATSISLATFCMNAVLLWLTSTLTPGFHITGLLPAFLGSVVLTFLGHLTTNFLTPTTFDTVHAAPIGY
jgi:uncharacterized membrane protein YvlD (DUF360 family)